MMVQQEMQQQQMVGALMTKPEPRTTPITRAGSSFVIRPSSF